MLYTLNFANNPFNSSRNVATSGSSLGGMFSQNYEEAKISIEHNFEYFKTGRSISFHFSNSTVDLYMAKRIRLQFYKLFCN